MIALAAVICGALAGAGIFAAVMGGQRRAQRIKLPKLKTFRTKRITGVGAASSQDTLMMIVLSAGLAFLFFMGTRWIVAGLIGAVAGIMGPIMFRAPRKRRMFVDEIEAYSQWTEQVRDLVSASGSLFEAVILSAEQAPPKLRSQVEQMASIARTLGLPVALDWFAQEMDSPFADRLVLGMKIAWDSGARVGEAFDSTARAMRAEVEMRRRNEVANSRAWTQVLAMLGITVVSVMFMFIFNRGFFDPFGSTLGQTVLAVVGVLIFGNVYWVLKLSESASPVRLLDAETTRSSLAQAMVEHQQEAAT